MKKIFASAAVAVMLVGPARSALAADREHQQMMADIRMLQEQAQQLAITLAAVNDALKTITASMNTRLDQQAEANRKAFADQKLLVDNMGADLRVIRERSDETNVRISSLEQELEALRAAIPPAMPFTPPDPNAAVDPNAPPPDPTQAAPAPVPSAAGLSPGRMFEQAMADYGAGQYTLAIEGFRALLRTFPNSDRSDDAQFYIGEAYYYLGNFQEAVNAYNQVIQRFVGSSLVPDAYYKRGVNQQELGDLAAARESWQTVIKNFKDSEGAGLAKQALDRVNAKKP